MYNIIGSTQWETIRAEWLKKEGNNASARS